MMRDDQPQVEEKESLKEQASPSTALNYSPCRKRLLADPKPNKGSTAASPDSALSSSDRFRKKTRELPNLSDCHSCGLRINNTNPKERLQTLDSVWRIVLLCKKCLKRVESAEICSYCSAETSEKDCFRCGNCERRIHKDCVVKYGGSVPWSYCSSVSGFSVCIDCWVPKLLLNSIRVRRKRNNRISSNLCSLADSRASVDSNGHKSLEDVMKDANSAVEQKIAVEVKAKENALRKAVMAKRAVELANNRLDLVAKKDSNGAKSECLVTSSSSSSSSCATTATTVVDDAELAFQLHRAMNSSPRISKNLCSMNSSCLAIPKIRNLNDNLLVKSSEARGSPCTSVCGKLEVCKYSRLIKKVDNTVSEPSVRFKATDSGSCIDLGILKNKKMTDERTGLKGKECQGNIEIDLAVGWVGKCSSGDGDRMDSKFQSCQKQDESSRELLQDDCITQCLLKCDGKDTLMNDGSCNGKPDRYLLKYSKRPTSSKAISNCENKFHNDAFHLENQASAPRLSLNCSKESRTFSDASYQSCVVNMQAFACVSGSAREQP